jgi:hypothetical protein
MLKTKILIVLLIPFACICTSAHAIDATAAPSTTKLGVSPRTVGIGVPVTLTAKVVLGAMPVRHGSIVFCDANAARCQGLAILGSAQLTSSGTATIKLTLGAGTYSVKAAFLGTPRSVPPVSSSTSAAQTITVSGSTRTGRPEGMRRR